MCNRSAASAALVVSLGVSACGAPAGPPAFDPVVEPLATPAGEGSLGPHVVVDAETAWLSFVEPDSAGHGLVVARLDGSEWRRVGRAASGADWFVNWADVPSVEPSGPGVLWAHWLERLGEDRYAYGVRIARSQDAGATWSEPAWLHDDRSATEHGFAALAGDGAGGVTAVWLDGAKYGTGENEMQVRARDFASDGTAGPETAVDARTCDCCPNAAVRLADGRLVAAYRDRSLEEVRDVAVASRSPAGVWGVPKLLPPTGWSIDSCPVNGPALATDGERVVAAWFTMEGAESRVFSAFSEDGGASFGAPIRVDEGRAVGRVDVALLEDGTAVVAWIEATGAGAGSGAGSGGGTGAGSGGGSGAGAGVSSGGRETHAAGIVARRVRADGSASPARLLVETEASRAAGYPRLAAHGSDLLLAWTEVSPERAVRTARVRLAK